MGLELSQLHTLLSTRGGALEVGRLPGPVAVHVGAKLGIVYLSQVSLAHIRERHPKISLLDMLCLGQLISDGLWIAESNGRACAVYSDRATNSRFIAAIKVAAAGYEVYLTTFHLCRPRQTASLLKRGIVLQTHK